MCKYEYKMHCVSKIKQYILVVIGNQHATVSLVGYLRGGRNLSANQLVHITGHGDFQIKQIDGVNLDNVAHNNNIPSKKSRKQQEKNENKVIGSEMEAVAVPPVSWNNHSFVLQLPNPETQVCFALLCFALLCFALLCFALLCFVLFCFVLFCFVLFCFYVYNPIVPLLILY